MKYVLFGYDDDYLASGSDEIKGVSNDLNEFLSMEVDEMRDTYELYDIANQEILVFSRGHSQFKERISNYLKR